MLNIEDYDSKPKVDSLNPRVREAIALASKRFKTKDVEKIKRLLHFGVVRELNLIEGHKQAHQYLKESRKARLDDDEDYYKFEV